MITSAATAPSSGPKERTAARRSERESDGQRDLRARRPVGPGQEFAAQDLVDDLRVHLDARLGGGARRRDEVAQPDGAGADQHDRSGDRVGVRRRSCRVEELRRGDAGHARQAGEIDAEVADRSGRHLEIADLERRHRRPAGVGLAARAGRADHEGACAERDAQRLDGKRRIELVLAPAEERHDAHDAVRAGRKAVEAEAARRFVQVRQVGKPAAEGQEVCLRVRRRRRRSRPSAAARLLRSRWSARSRRSPRCGRTRRRAARRCRRGWAAGRPSRRRGSSVCRRGAERGAVRLGEDDVEGDRRRAELRPADRRSGRSPSAARAIGRPRAATPRRCRR